MSAALKQGVLSGLSGDHCKPDPLGSAHVPGAMSRVPAHPAPAADPARRPALRPDAVGSVGPALALLGMLVVLLLTGCGPAGRRELLEGQRLLAQGRNEEAVAVFREAVRAFSTNALAAAQAWNHLGVAYHRSGQADNAALCYKAALDKDLNLFAARYNRGYLFFERTNYAAAISELTTYTTQLPEDPAGWLLLGKAQLRANLVEASQQNLQKVRRLPASNLQQAEALNALGVGYARRRKAPEAFQHFEAALSKAAGYPPALLNQAVLSHQTGDLLFAQQKFQAYLDRTTNAPAAPTLRNLTNQIARTLAAARPPARPPVAPASLPTNVTATASNLVMTLRTSVPPSTVSTSTKPTVVATSPPPVVVKTSPPARVVEAPPPAPQPTSAPPSVVAGATNAPPPARVVEAGSEPPALAAVDSPPTAAGVPSPSPEPGSKASPELEPAAPPTAEAEAPVETVDLGREPEFKPASDLAAAEVPPPAASVSTTPPSATGAPQTLPTAVTEEPRKRSLISRLNPVGWFGSKESDPEKEKARALEEQAEREAKLRKAEEKAAEKARRRAPEPAREATRLASARAPATAPSPAVAPAPVIPRYQYRNPSPAAPGDRAKANQLVMNGVREHQAGRLAEAQSIYTRALEADPACFNAWFNQAVMAFDLQDWKKSLATYEQALALKPDDSRARYGFALTLEKAGYPLDAAAELDRVLSKDGNNVEAHLAAANLYATTLADPAKAREHYLRVLQLQPNHPQAGMIRRWLGPLPR